MDWRNFLQVQKYFLRNSHQNSHSGAKKDNRLWGRLVNYLFY
jgi:hypothetical protein